MATVIKVHPSSKTVSSVLIGVVYHPPQASVDDNNEVYDHIQKTVDS